MGSFKTTLIDLRTLSPPRESIDTLARQRVRIRKAARPYKWPSLPVGPSTDGIIAAAADREPLSCLLFEFAVQISNNRCRSPLRTASARLTAPSLRNSDSSPGLPRGPSSEAA